MPYNIPKGPVRASDPAFDANALTLSGTTTITDANGNAGLARGIYVGGAGNLTVITSAGNQVSFSNVPVGTIVPIVCSAVVASTTTATGLVAMF